MTCDHAVQYDLNTTLVPLTKETIVPLIPPSAGTVRRLYLNRAITRQEAAEMNRERRRFWTELAKTVLLCAVFYGIAFLASGLAR